MGVQEVHALPSSGQGGMQFFMIRQKNIIDINSEINIIHYSNLSTLKCSNLKYNNMIILVIDN